MSVAVFFLEFNQYIGNYRRLSTINNLTAEIT